MKKKLLTLLEGSLVFFLPAVVLASILQGFQGGTGTSTAPSAGLCLQSASTSPWLTYTFGTCGSTTTSQWTTTSTGIFYNSGNVGIGTTTASSTLTVNGSLAVLNASGTYALRVSTSTSNNNLFEVTNNFSTAVLSVSSSSITTQSGGTFVLNNAALALGYNPLSTSSTLLATDQYVPVYNYSSSSITITLPSSTMAGRLITVKDANGTAGTYPLYISPTGSTTIQNTTSSIGIYNAYGSLDFIYDGSSNWQLN